MHVCAYEGGQLMIKKNNNNNNWQATCNIPV